MTIMRVSLSGTTLSDAQKEVLAARLIDAFAAIEVGHAAPEVEAGFVVLFETLERTDLWMGKRPMADATASGRAAIVSAQVMAGPWNDEMKRDLFRTIEGVVRDAAEIPKEGNGANFWMTIVEVPEGGWGLGGRPVSIAKLAPVFQEDRRERIGRYLERHWSASS